MNKKTDTAGQPIIGDLHTEATKLRAEALMRHHEILNSVQPEDGGWLFTATADAKEAMMDKRQAPEIIFALFQTIAGMFDAVMQEGIDPELMTHMASAYRVGAGKMHAHVSERMNGYHTIMLGLKEGATPDEIVEAAMAQIKKIINTEEKQDENSDSDISD